MKKLMKKLTVTLFVCVCLGETVWAQGQSRAQSSSWRRNTAIVLFSGIGGSLLGLSTLSFYGNPKEHTDNITTGGFMGLMAGIGYVAYEAAPKLQKKNYDYYSLFMPTEQIKRPTIASVPSVQFDFTF